MTVRAAPKPPMTVKQRQRFRRRIRGVPPDIRRQVFERDRVCQWCLRAGGHLDPHHRLPRGQGGKDDLRTLVAVHRGCHRFAHEHPAEARRRGFLVSSVDDLDKGWT